MVIFFFFVIVQLSIWVIDRQTSEMSRTKTSFAQRHRELCSLLAPFTTYNILFSFNRKLFFTDYGNAAKVERCDMDGMNRTWIVDSKIEQPTALALDLINKYVYWVDIYLDSLEVVDYQGRKRQTIIKGRQVGICKLVRSNYINK